MNYVSFFSLNEYNALHIVRRQIKKIKKRQRVEATEQHTHCLPYIEGVYFAVSGIYERRGWPQYYITGDHTVFTVFNRTYGIH